MTGVVGGRQLGTEARVVYGMLGVARGALGPCGLAEQRWTDLLRLNGVDA